MLVYWRPLPPLAIPPINSRSSKKDAPRLLSRYQRRSPRMPDKRGARDSAYPLLLPRFATHWQREQPPRTRSVARSAAITSAVYTASLSSLAGRNATFLLALILMVSPVAGFRPIRAARLRT